MIQTCFLVSMLCMLPCLYSPLSATAQVIAFDPTNMAAQIKNIAQFRAQLQQLSEQTKIVKEVRDAARRARREYQTLTNTIDRAVRISDARSGITRQLNERLHGGISYHMDARQWSETFAMGREESIDADYGLHMNERAMETVTATMSTLHIHEDEVARLTEHLDVLGAQLPHTKSSEERQAIQASIALLEAQREVRQTQLDIARANIKGTLQAMQIDAAQNEAMQQQRDRKNLQEYAQFLKQQDW